MTSATSEYRASVDSITRREWNEILQEFDDATIYQTWDYGAVCWGEEQLSHLVLRRDGRITGMAQVRLVRVPLIGKGIAYVRWGPLWQLRGQPRDENAFREIMSALREEYVKHRGLVLRVIPSVFRGETSENLVRECLEDLGFVHNPEIHTYRTLRVDLTKGEDELRKGLQSRWRNYLKNAEKAGYCVREGESDDYYSAFARAYQEMMNRKRFETTVDIEEFRRVHRNLPHPLKLHVLICENDGVLLNALVIAAAGSTGIYLLAATSDAGLQGRGAFLLQWHGMQWLKQRGCRWYDLGGANPEMNPGVYQFKSGLGGEDARHLGAYELCKDAVSGLCVAGGEKLRTLTRSLKTVLKR